MTDSAVSRAMVVLVSDRALVVVPQSTDEGIVERLRSVLRAEDPGDELISALVSGGLGRLPSLGTAVRVPSGVRVLVRGAVVFEVDRGDGSAVQVSAPATLATWREEVLDGAVSVRVVGDDACLQAEWYPTSVLWGSAEGSADPMLGDRDGAGTGLEIPTPSVETEGVDELEPDPDPGDGVDEDDGEAEGVDPGLLTLAGPYEAGTEPGETILPLDGREVAASDDDVGFDFAHLLEETQFRGVEAAAVRATPEDEAEDAAEALHEDEDWAAAASERPESPPVPEASVPSSAPSPPPASSPSASSSGLIDGVPGLGAAPPVAPAQEPGDHDGLTIAKAQLAGVLGGVAASGAGASPTPAVKGPTVRAVHCGAGHPNPAHGELCRVCGGPIIDRAVRQIPRPPLGRLRFSSGPLVELDRPLVIGRRPTADLESSTAELPALVTLQDPEQSLSRTHLEVRFEGWEVFVVDRSSNGTVVDLPGQAPLRLRKGEPCLIVPATRVHMSDTHEFVFEVGER